MKMPSPVISANTSSWSSEDLLPGSYTIDLVAYNDDDPEIAIGDGSNTADVGVGSTAQVTVTVVEYAGTGSFDLDLAWEPAIITTPIIDGKLIDGQSVETVMVFSNVNPVAATADSLTEDLDNGWYANIVKVLDDTVLSTGYADVVRIASGYVTEADIFLHAVEGHGGIQILVDLDFFDPLHFTGAPVEGDIDIYQGQQIQFSVTEDDTIPFTGAWYLNGDAVGTGDNYTVAGASMFDGESYRLDFIGWSLDGEHAGAVHWGITKQETPLDSIVGSFVASAGGLNAQVQLYRGVESWVDTASVVTLTPPAATSFIFFSLDPAEQFKLKVEEDTDGANGFSPGDYFEWYENTDSSSTATQIDIPRPADFVADFGTLDFTN